MIRNGIPTIKVETPSISGEYKVSEATAHKIVRMLLEDIEKDLT